MNIVFEPKVYLVGQQVVNQAELDRFLSDHGVSQWTTDTNVAGEKLCEIAGRLCYLSFAHPRPGGNSAYLKHILEVGHGSVLEHAVFNFIITGVSRSCTHELVRHRAGFGFSQLSQRYVDESTADFVKPDCLQDMRDNCPVWDTIINTTQETYKVLVDMLTDQFSHIEDKTLRRKMARQAARSVLPNATETKIFVTANARALRHFLELRGTEHAEVEIRKLAVAMLNVLKNASPNLFGDYVVQKHEDGTEVISTQYRKV